MCALSTALAIQFVSMLCLTDVVDISQGRCAFSREVSKATRELWSTSMSVVRKAVLHYFPAS